MATNSEAGGAAVLPQHEEEDETGSQGADPTVKSYDLKEEEEVKEDKDESQQNGAGNGEAGDSGNEQLIVLEEDGEKEQLGPRDEIKVTVTGYQRTADNCTFDVEVHA